MRVLIISPIEYGNLIDHTMWSKYLSINNIDVTHLSIGNSEIRNINSNIRIIKVKKIKNKIIKNIIFIFNCIKIIKEYKYNGIIIDYFPGCSLIKMFNYKKKMIVDIRTTTISNNKLKKKIRDFMIKIESNIFDNISIITPKLIEILKLNSKKVKILPLGSECVVNLEKSKSNDILKILYVGTLDNRNIESTIKAIKKCIDNKIYNIRYTIIGFSKYKSNEDNLNNIIRSYNLNKYVKFLGKVEHDKLKSYYENNNIGLSYIPCKDYFNYQPPTKTYEYIINGLYCIATKTKANEEIIIDKVNGELIFDSEDELANSIIKLAKDPLILNTKKISQTLNNFLWSSIIENNLIPIFECNKNE